MRSIVLSLCTASALAIVLPIPSLAALSFRSTRIDVNVGTDGPQAIAVKDLDGVNGDDIIAVDFDDDTVSVFLNQGGGQFGGTPLTFQTGSGPIAVITGDFNDDGKVDIATANAGDNTVTVLLGDGSGSSFTRADFGLQADPVAMIAAGFDNDRCDDLVVLSADTFYVYKSSCDGTFGLTQSLPTRGSDSFAVAAGLFNSDVFVDLAVSNSDTDEVVTFLGNGDDTFKLNGLYEVGVTPGDILARPLTGGSSADLVVVNLDLSNLEQELSLLVSNGDGTFQNKKQVFITGIEQTSALTTTDLDGDGLVDIITGSNASPEIGFVRNCGQDAQSSVRCPYGAPQGGFQLGGVVNGLGLASDEATAAIKAGNLDGRGGGLIVLDEGGSTIIEFLSSSGSVTQTPVGGSATPTGSVPPTSTPTAPTATPSATWTLTPVPTPTPIPSAPYTECNTKATGQPAVGGKPVAVAIGDFYRDGNPAIAVADNQGNRVLLLRPHIDLTKKPDTCGVLGLTSETELQNIAAPVALMAADLNLDQDRNPDLAVVGSAGSAGFLSVFFGDGKGGFQASSASPMPAGTNPRALAVADFNRDGLPDIIVADAGTNNVSIFSGAGQRSFQSPCVVPVGRKTSFVVTGDFDGDGLQDFAVASQQPNAIVVFLQVAPTPGSSSSTCPVFTNLGQITLSEQPQALVSGSFGLNGSISGFGAAGPSGSAGAVEMFLGSAGRSGVSSQLSVPVPAGSATRAVPSALATGDVNGDGLLDLIVTDANNNDVVIFLAKNDGSFPRTLIPFLIDGQEPVGLAVGDIDGDGAPDIVTANEGDGSVSILLSSVPPPTPTPLPTNTPTVTGTPTQTGAPTATPTPTPSGTPTSTLTNTPLPTSTPVPSPVPTNTMKPGTISLQGSCAVDATGTSGDRTWSVVWMVAASGLVWRRRSVQRVASGR